jgi:ribose 5-phosphate isomerase B
VTEEERIRRLVRRVVYRTLGREDSRGPGSEKSLVFEEDVAALAPGSTLELAEGARMTPLARQMAMERGIEVFQGSSAGRVSAGDGDGVLALGADHGGFEMKELLKEHVQKLGYAVVDCGTHSQEAVDYPDLAFAVARLVSEGRAWRGILVDGAGIGSAMAANKVPGVRAALCYDQATARNSREHNNANVLTLGAGLIGASLARQIVTLWLETDFGGGRHGARVEKIMEIEARFLKR